eukprot:TRINITY_DN7726_c0_g1_i2.p1 TRINITY_DN7726_c0_g1~~TRINITY_DN7726_c0_g1_i2.p1  ORF type:complete len:221 (+),score=33.36 TRINITY_DN7726_c0_g1_i2:64-726(+)
MCIRDRLQSCYFAIEKFAKVVEFEREFIQSNNKVELYIDWASLPKDSALNTMKQNVRSKTMVIILPGLTGTKKGIYVRQACLEFLEKGFEKVGVCPNRWSHSSLNFRGKDTFDFYQDAYTVFYDLRKRFQDYKIFAIGHSFGANNLVNFLGDVDQEKRTLDGAISVSNPLDFVESAKHLKGTLTNRFLAYCLRSAILKYEDELKLLQNCLLYTSPSPRDS